LQRQQSRIHIMKAIKFVCRDKHQQLFVATLRKNVNEYFKANKLSTKGNTALVIQSLFMLALYIIPFLLVLYVPMNAWTALTMSIVMGIGIAGIGMGTMHDAVHGSYSRREWVNKLFGGTLYLLGSYVLNWKIQHNVLHHTYTNIEGRDEDIASRGPIRLSEHAPLRRIHRYQYIHAFFFYGLLTLAKLVKDFTQLARYNKTGITLQNQGRPAVEYTKMVLVKLAYLFVIIGLPILFTEFSWWQVLLGFFIMHWVAGCILSTVFQMAHVVEGTAQPLPNKDGIVENDWVIHELQTTADFGRDNRLLTWYAGGLNFQIEHHLFPSICHIHYPRIAPIIENTAREFGYPYNAKPSLLAALSSHVKRLKQLGAAA
jgi:linoleoyl-CoA desaturase